MAAPTALVGAAVVGNASTDDRRDAVIATVDATWRELHAGAPPAAITPGSVLDRDLGFDSLARMELLLLLEQRVGVHLAEDTLQRAETVGDLCDSVGRASAAGTVPSVPVFDETRLEREAGAADDAAAEPAHGSPLDAPTLLAAFEWHLAAHADRVQVTCLADDHETPLSHRALAADARAIAAGLQREGVAPRDCVALMLPTGPEYFAVFLGVLMAGAIPVPIYPPARASQLEDHVLRHAGILDNAQAVLLVTVPEAMVPAKPRKSRFGRFTHCTGRRKGARCMRASSTSTVSR